MFSCAGIVEGIKGGKIGRKMLCLIFPYNPFNCNIFTQNLTTNTSINLSTHLTHSTKRQALN